MCEKVNGAEEETVRNGVARISGECGGVGGSESEEVIRNQKALDTMLMVERKNCNCVLLKLRRK